MLTIVYHVKVAIDNQEVKEATNDKVEVTKKYKVNLIRFLALCRLNTAKQIERRLTKLTS
jgi:hypothetical protein